MPPVIVWSPLTVKSPVTLTSLLTVTSPVIVVVLSSVTPATVSVLSIVTSLFGIKTSPVPLARSSKLLLLKVVVMKLSSTSKSPVE